MKTNTFVKLTFAVLAFLVAVLPVKAQLNAENAFRTIPSSVIPYYDENMRLDLIDYAKASLPNTVKNGLNAESKINVMTDNYIDLTVTPSVNLQIAVLPIRERKIIAIIKTVMTPAPDSELKFYAGNWAPIDLNLFSAPTLDDCLNADGKKNVAKVVENVPFLMTGYRFNESDMSMTISLNLNQYLTVEAYDEVKSLLHPELVYRWDGKKFVKK